VVPRRGREEARMRIYTIGWTQRSAEEFFGILKKAGVKRIVDVRLHNDNNLGNFTRVKHLPFFAKRLLGAEYSHSLDLAPDEKLFNDFKNGIGWVKGMSKAEKKKLKKITWNQYIPRFKRLIRGRRIEEKIPKAWFKKPAVLLCGEPEPEKCHRSLVAEHLQKKWRNVEVVHL
jgi:uncharacterized protein (DUF488 family)